MRKPTRQILIAGSLVTAVGLVACGGDDSQESEAQSGPVLAVDERAGTVEGVGIGDDAAAIERVFGDAPPYDIYTEITPVDVDSADLTYPREGGCGGPAGRTLSATGASRSFCLRTKPAR